MGHPFSKNTSKISILTKYYDLHRTTSKPSNKNNIFHIYRKGLNQRLNTHSPQSHLDTSPNRNITFNLPYTDETHDETHDTLHDDILTTSSAQNTSVNVASPTRTIPDSTRYITRPRYDPPSIPSAFRSNTSISSNNNFNDNPQTSNQYYAPFN